jgi:hypothetical protein
MHAFFLTTDLLGSSLEEPGLPLRSSIRYPGVLSIGRTHRRFGFDPTVTLSWASQRCRSSLRSVRFLFAALRLAVRRDPSAQLLRIEAAAASKLVAGKVTSDRLIVDPVLVQPEQLGDLAGGHHRLHRCSSSA